ncbi:tRNA (mnm(5)s(2)U34)-methyltransferase [Heyndrickxia acidiproducens]|uniref:tRNA (mnm(5)s(2)U34)-methyltransferase n=1 Tax=Heyndrickxia acidiproducens TaxID=1121084 RepID=UPI000374F40A|nr:class I SAM-dependent methyltransferase [Heyndrickxia acidiproducens]
MNMLSVIQFAHALMEKTVPEGGFAIDATAGNGLDTAFLAGLTGESGKVFAFDIQKTAVNRTAVRLQKAGLENRVQLFQTGHEHAGECIPAFYHGKISGALFNLGYLPKSDKSIITRPETTISAVRQILDMLQTGGIIAIVVYHGHDGGGYERDQLLKFAKTLDQKQAHVLQYGFINQENHPPFVIAIEKR